MRTFTENQVLKIIEHLETKGFNDDCLTYEEELEYILEQPLVKSIEVIYCCKSDSELLPTLLKNTNRVEVIDQQGRTYVNWKPTNKVELSLQDNERTLKVFIND
jgi:hypothetical protein